MCDTKRLKFCHEGGDQLTNLNVYWKWAQQDRANFKKWCYENNMNAKSMNYVDKVVSDLRCILWMHGIEMPTSLMSFTMLSTNLPTLIFNAYLNNLAVCLGHERAARIHTQ